MSIHVTAYVEEGVVLGKNVSVGPFCILRKGSVLGDNCSLTAYCEIRENVIVGKGTSMGSRCTISAGAVIGEHTVIKYGFVLTDTPDLTKNSEKLVRGVGSNVLIGANVTLMPGVSIGDNAIIGACSQVRVDVPENEVWYGSPAKFYRTRRA